MSCSFQRFISSQVYQILTAIAVLLSVGSFSDCVAGTLTGRITDLFAQPRSGIEVQYVVEGIDPDNGEIFEIQGPQTFVTSPGMGTSGGKFSLSFRDDRYRPNTQEIIISLTSDSLTPVKLTSLLGPARHSLQVVMPEQRVYESFEVDVSVAAYFGKRASLHLLGEEGSIFYCLPTGDGVLSPLRISGSDDRFFYYRQTDLPQQFWAIGRHLNHFGQIPIWYRSRSGPWQRFECVRKVVPMNGKGQQLGEIIVSKFAGSLKSHEPDNKD